MANDDDHLFNRIVHLVTDFVDGTDKKPVKPPPIPKGAKKKKSKKKRPRPEIHRHEDRMTSCQQRAILFDDEQAETIAAALSALAQSMEMEETLVCFTDDQLFKLDIGYDELMRNAGEQLTCVLDVSEAKARSKKLPKGATAARKKQLAKLEEAAPHFKEMTGELHFIRDAAEAGAKPKFDEFIDALGRALEIVGYDERLMEVEKKKEPDTVPGDILPKHCRIALTVKEGSKAKRGQAISLSMTVKDKS